MADNRHVCHCRAYTFPHKGGMGQCPLNAQFLCTACGMPATIGELGHSYCCHANLEANTALGRELVLKSIHAVKPQQPQEPSK